MPVDTRHPDYLDRAPEWRLLRDALRGETRIKAQAERYLPVPSSMRRDRAAYEAYLGRADFPEALSGAIRAMVGLMHRRPARVELPPPLIGMIGCATDDAVPLKALAQRIAIEVLITGRYALAVDLPAAGGRPYLIGYPAESLINWRVAAGDGARRLVQTVCETNEAVPAPGDPFMRRVRQVWQVRSVDADDGHSVDLWARDPGEEAPRLVARRRPIVPKGFAPVVPVIVIGAGDLDPTPDAPPLLAGARSALSIYRLSADHRHNLFMRAHEQLVLTGVRETERPKSFGTSGAWAFSNPEAKAYFVGTSGIGLEEQRRAIDAEYERLADHLARLAETGRAREGADALALRLGGKTASLRTVAETVGQGIERALKRAAEWVGADPDKVVYAPSLDFLETGAATDLIAELRELIAAGLLPRESLWQTLRRYDLLPAEATDTAIADAIGDAPAPDPTPR